MSQASKCGAVSTEMAQNDEEACVPSGQLGFSKRTDKRRFALATERIKSRSSAGRDFDDGMSVQHLVSQRFECGGFRVRRVITRVTEDAAERW